MNMPIPQSWPTRVSKVFRRWKQVNKHLNDLIGRADELAARRELLAFQVKELQQLGLDNNELSNLEKEQQTLANAGQILEDSHNLLAICDQSEGFNIRDGLNRALSILSGLKHKPDDVAQRRGDAAERNDSGGGSNS